MVEYVSLSTSCISCLDCWTRPCGVLWIWWSYTIQCETVAAGWQKTCQQIVILKVVYYSDKSLQNHRKPKATRKMNRNATWSKKTPGTHSPAGLGFVYLWWKQRKPVAKTQAAWIKVIFQRNMSVNHHSEWQSAAGHYDLLKWINTYWDVRAT